MTPRHIPTHTPVITRQDAPDGAFPARDAALHDLANLLDAATRCAASAARDVDPLRAIAALEAALAQMGELLPAVTPRARTPFPRDAALSVRDAILHAVNLMQPAAAEHVITISARADDALRSLAAPGLFRVITDALRNSMESIQSLPGPRRGHIEVVASLGGTGDDTIDIRITDDGAGPPAGDTDQLVPGASTKPGSSGLGLAVARHIIQRFRGTVELRRADGANPTNPDRPGATLRIVIPAPSLPRVAP